MPKVKDIQRNEFYPADEIATARETHGAIMSQPIQIAYTPDEFDEIFERGGFRSTAYEWEVITEEEFWAFLRKQVDAHVRQAEKYFIRMRHHLNTKT